MVYVGARRRLRTTLCQTGGITSTYVVDSPAKGAVLAVTWAWHPVPVLQPVGHRAIIGIDL